MKWSSDPLLLPGETSERIESAGSLDLALPDVDDGDDAQPSPAREDLASSADGWQRARPRLTPPPMAGYSPRSGDGIAGLGDALSLVESRSRPSQTGLDLATEMHERFALGDYSAALVSAELILGRDPDDPDALEISAESRERLAGLYIARLGTLAGTPRVAVDVDVRWLGLDSRAAFVLSQLDGRTSIETLIDLSGMSRLDALRTLTELLDIGAIVL